jgi:hypothetical protein
MRSCRKSVSSRYRPAGTIAGVWRSRHRQWIEKWAEENRELARENRKRHEDWLVGWRAQAKEQKLRFDAIDAAMENDKRVTREMVLQLQALRAEDKERHDESRAMIDGLMRVLDRLDRDDGSSPAGA